ncbi:MAG TPA: hypothetical protein VHU19_03025 [Pyrinomonadaceae bacterium]|jgi:hypothetical protein|nr:hypothetical protein [Pyrinomonadaceae bacterium]
MKAAGEVIAIGRTAALLALHPTAIHLAFDRRVAAASACVAKNSVVSLF